MTNREMWIAKLKEVSTREIANIFCNTHNCWECPGCRYSANGDCIRVLENWLEAEHEEKGND